MASKDRYISKKDFAEYEKYKNDKQKGRLLNPEGLVYLADSVENDPFKLGMLLLEKVSELKKEDPFLDKFSDAKLYFNPEKEKILDEDDAIPFVEYKK